MRLHIDFETYCPLDVRKVGTYRYTSHPEFQVLLMGWAIDDDDVQVFSPGQNAMNWPQELLFALNDENCTVHAFNATFERQCLLHAFGRDIPHHRWRCTAVHASSLGFMGNLDHMLLTFGVKYSKLQDGPKLIRQFCQPDKYNQRITAAEKPDDWRMFEYYCIQDVRVERELYYKCEEYVDYPEPDYTRDQLINDRGIPLDHDLIGSAMALDAESKCRLYDDLCLRTGLANPASQQQFLAWLTGGEIENIQVDDVRKETLTELLARDDVTEETKDIIRDRMALTKTSVAKWRKLAECVSYDTGRIHGTLQFNGASRTGRWSGRHFQPQNLARPVFDDVDDAVDLILSGADMDEIEMYYGSVRHLLSSLVRSAVKADPGHKLVVCDWAGIESRIAGWVTGCPVLQNVFAQGLDPYKNLATHIFGVPYDEVTKEQRTICKPASLGAQYMLGAKGLVAYAGAMGVELTEEEGQAHISKWRELHSAIHQYWYDLEEMVFTALTSPWPVEVGPYDRELEIHTIGSGDDKFLYIELPSGRRLHYFQPELQKRRVPWTKPEQDPDHPNDLPVGVDEDGVPQYPVYRWQFTYMGRNQFTTQWERIAVHPGKIFENVVQAIGADVMRTGLERAFFIKLPVIFHVHDEIVVHVKDSKAELALEKLEELMTESMPWAPDMLLEAEGYVAERYRK